MPGVVLRTTMIVGHPGETEEDFEELMSFLEEARFERLGAFCYSEEEGTWGAANLKDDIPEEEKHRRLEELMELQARISLEFNESRVGSTERVIVDSIVGDSLVCRSYAESPEVDGEVIVKNAGGIPVGAYIDVRITEAGEYDLVGEIING